LRKLFILTLLATQVASAQVIDKNDSDQVGTLWNDQKGNAFTDRTARRKGDILTVVISEASSATYTATTNASKADNNSISLNLFNNIVQRLVRPWTSQDSSSNQGTGTTTRNGKVTARMAVVVTDVLPNGNLLIEGGRTLMVNKELQTFKITGIVRRDDVKSDNTVMSENIAEADIRLEGKGLIQDRQRRGLLTQLLDWLF